jgi:hypothetical protein
MITESGTVKTVLITIRHNQRRSSCQELQAIWRPDLGLNVALHLDSLNQ